MRACPVLLLVPLAACFASPPAGRPCGPELACATGEACVAGACQPSADVDAPAADAPNRVDACATTCAGDVLVACDATVKCLAGCVSDDGADAHCARIVPSNGATWPTQPLGPLTVTLGAVLDTDTGAIATTTGMTVRGAGPGIIDGLEFLPATSISAATLRTGGLEVAAGATLLLTGTAPLMLVVGGDALVAGTIDLGAGCLPDRSDGSCPGPGGGEGGGRQLLISAAAGCGAGRNGVGGGSASESGGGGGGFGAAGGDGGATSTSGASAGGLGCGTATLEPLVGGSGGGAGGIDGTLRYGGRGGGGGGALQLSVAGELVVTGTVDASGGGGEAVPSTPGEDGGGGGGGSGGGILLEATSLVISGVVVANGGGGGSGFDGMDGERGRRSTARAAGGPATGGGTAGGRGGARTGSAEPGITSAPNVDSGGGGGGVGHIVVRAPSLTMIGGTISPAPRPVVAVPE